MIVLSFKMETGGEEVQIVRMVDQSVSWTSYQQYICAQTKILAVINNFVTKSQLASLYRKVSAQTRR